MDEKKKKEIDENIALELMCGDQETAFRAILKYYAPGIMRWVVLLPFGLTIEDAEDIVSESMAKLWKARDQYDESHGSVRTYLFQIVKNTIRDRAKTKIYKLRKLRRIVDDEHLKHLAAPQKKSQTALEPNSPQIQAVREILHGMSTGTKRKWRDVVIEYMNANNEPSAAEVGSRLGMPATTIRGYKRRGHEYIRAELAKRGFTGNAGS